MMIPPLFATVSQDAAVQAVFGAPPVCRVYAFGEAPQGTPYPYATWTLVSGLPENYHDDRPDVDAFDAQIDVWGSAGDALDGAEALRDALEPAAYVTAWRGASRDRDTGACRYSFDVAFIEPRA